MSDFRPASPIADLSYRSYDGPMEKPGRQWIPIARSTMKMGIQKKGFWLMAGLSTWYYIVMLMTFYVIGNIMTDPTGRGASAAEQIFARVVWKDQFLHAFSYAQMIFLVLAIMLGAGSIANDNRANALLVYLSKPVRKIDYLMGKWLGIVVVLTLVNLIPMLFFYLYCLMSYREYGFISQDPWLIVKILILAPVPGIIYGSIAVCISSLFKQGRMAGATFAGIYFFSYFFTFMVSVMRIMMLDNSTSATSLWVDWLYYLSIDGVNIAMAKIILGTRGSPPFVQVDNMIMPPIPSILVFGVGTLLACAAGMYIAWTRIRAVEVVR